MFTVYDGVEAYARKANSGLYIACKTAIFNDPKNQILTPKGKITRVRQYESGMAGNYSKNKGWMTSYGTGKGVQWIEYKAEYDRAKILTTDAIDEEQSFAVGMTPSIELLNADFLDNQLPREIDATNIAKWYSQVPEANKHVNTESGFGTDEDSILATLNNLDRLEFNSGYDRDTVLFMNAEAYANMISAIQNKFGLASNVLMEKQATVYIDTGLGSLIKGTDSMIKVNITFEVYGHFLIIRVPDDRMYTKIIMFSGDPDDEGQEAGGYVPDSSNSEFANIALLAIPIEAAFTNTRYMVDNFLYPAFLQTNPYTSVDIRELNKRMYGNVEINNAGINQKANAFEYDIRAIYGGSLFANRARNCFAVTGPIGAVDELSLTVNTDISNSTDLLGKTINQLQTGVVFDDANGVVTGTLNYVSDYTGFSGDPAEQSGNYLVFKAVPNIEGAVVSAKINNTSVLDSDHIAVFRVTDTTKNLVITATKDGYTPVTKVYALSGLTLANS